VALARTLLRLWKLRLWVGVGLIVATLAAIASLTMFHSTVYAVASTQMLVDSPQSALANASIDLTGYNTRAETFSRLMTSAEALQDIGAAAGIPGNLIGAEGPPEVDGAPVASHAPTIAKGTRVTASSRYRLALNQNPLLPTVEVTAEAPTTVKAIALANGAVTGFATFLNRLEASNSVPAEKRVVIRALGPATGGMVDPGASKSIALLIWLAVFAIWCTLLLWVKDLRGQLRAVQAADPDSAADAIAAGLPGRAAPAAHFATNGSNGSRTVPAFPGRAVSNGARASKPVVARRRVTERTPGADPDSDE
jgi:hypothetical protein